MKKELTNEEIAKVFAMYWGSSFYRKDDKHYTTLKSRTYIDVLASEYLLCAIPLAKISDEDAIEIAKFVYTDAVGVMELIQIGNDYVSYNLCGGKLSTYSAQRLNQFSCVEDIQIFQYLISKGHAVPLFFAPNHWANGKTAIELGIAIDATTIKADI